MKFKYLGVVIMLLMGGCVPEQAEVPPMPALPAIPTSPGEAGVIVHLFEWTWADVAQECEAFLGPQGYHAVQVSPPLENAIVNDPPRPWWEKYQPVSYQLDNRAGDREAFAEMVSRCNNAGVEIYVDIILNHMTGVYSGVGTAGSTFGEYDYPGLYGYDDFHHCGLTENDDIWDFDDPEQVRNCELVNLADLATESEKVRTTLVGYLNDLLSLGVTGFRLDTGRHIPPADLEAIFSRLDHDDYYLYQEVIDFGQQPTWAMEYLHLGAVTEFRYSATVSNRFYEGRLDELHGDGSIWEGQAFLPSTHALVFIDNHDNQRGHGAGGHIVTHKDGPLYDLAEAYMLAYPYGTTRVMSSYAFEADYEGPPATPDQAIARVHQEDGTVDCFGDTWQCEHRRPAIAGMVPFRRAVAGTPVTHWWTGTRAQIAFGRGDRGFIALNAEADETLTATLQTSLAAGRYCNVMDGTRTAEGTACTGAEVTVADDGTVALRLGPRTGAAFHVGSRIQE